LGRFSRLKGLALVRALVNPVASVTRLPEGLSTEALVRRALEGDRAAESLLYRRFAGGVLITALRLLRSHPAAEDVVQDSFVIGFARLAQLKTPSQFRAWLLSIVVSQARKRLRRERLLQWVGLDAVADAPLHQQALGSASVEARGELAVLDALLKQLPVAHRLAWTLRYVEGEKLDDVAAVMGKSLATTKRYLQAAELRISAHVAMETP
jgi:RNA polymerase sigma-70 factor (ECF subfamily)